MLDSENPNLNALEHDLLKNRPVLKRVRQTLIGKDEEIFDVQSEEGVAYFPESAIRVLVEKNFPQSVWKRATEFTRQFFLHFYIDRNYTIPIVIEEIGKADWRHTNEYFDFFESFLKEAAVVGFPEISAAFSPYQLEIVQQETGRSIFDARNILALRIYLADLIMHLLSKRMEQLQEASQDGDIEKIPAIFGSRPVPKMGIMEAKEKFDLDESDPNQTSYDYDRHLVHHVYIPDVEQSQSLLEIGQLLGRTNQSGRGDTFRVVGAMTLVEAKKLFPDIEDPKVDVSKEWKLFIQNALGLEYEDSKKLFQTEFAHEG